MKRSVKKPIKITLTPEQILAGKALQRAQNIAIKEDLMYGLKPALAKSTKAPKTSKKPKASKGRRLHKPG